MKLDLSPLTRKLNDASGVVRVEGPASIELDPDALLGRLADAAAHMMGQNILNGRRPDGGGMMPGRERDGRPRGLGAQVAATLHAERLGSMRWRIVANEKKPGHLARILREVPLRPPPLERFQAAVDAAFAKSVKVNR